MLSGILSFLLNRALRCRTVAIAGAAVHLGSLCALVLVLAEVLSQFWLATRTPDIVDLLCGVLGVHVFGGLAAWSQRKSTTHQ